MSGLIERVADLRARRRSLAAPVGLVPTMGALHDGHAELIRRARRECAAVVVSIFVNPLQFDRADDLAQYPRTLADDVAVCRSLGADLVFAPPADEMYPQPQEMRVDVGRLADHLCGPFRPGHFQGVATVVLKLFGAVQPDRAYFGQKDAQQVAIVERLTADFNLPIEIVPVPTVREDDGLAMSSRNRHLSTDERRLAPSLYQALVDAQRRIEAGERDAGAVRRSATRCIPAAADVKLEYLDIVDPATMQPVETIGGPVRVAGAMWVGRTRLIDNVAARPPESRPASHGRPEGAREA